MIHILLLILKIIGIVLLAALVLVLLMLFYPVLYRVKAEVKNKSGTGDVVVHWLFHFVHFRLKYQDNNVTYVLRVLGIPVVSSKNKGEKKNKAGDESSKIKENPDSDLELKTKDTQNIDEQNTEPQGYEEKEKLQIEKSKISDKIKSFINRIKSLIEKVKNFFKQSVRNAKAAGNKVKEIKSFITANTTKEAYNYGKRIIIKLIKHILPKKINADIKFGFGEPHLTGQTLGYIAMAFSTFGINPKKIAITPDFENKIFEGKAKLRGRILLGIVGIYILKLYFKKETHDIIKKFS